MPKPFHAAPSFRRARRAGRAGAARFSISLRFEALEERRLLHAGFEHDEPMRDFDVQDELCYFPAFLDDSTGIDAPASGALHPLTSIPLLDSYPVADVDVYLDFDGFFESNWGGYQNVTTPVFDRDGDPTTFSDSELATIESIWARVGEDFAPFNVNVTTVEPPSFANGVALRVAIGGDGEWTGGNYGGIAFVNNFTSGVTNTVYVFPDNLVNGHPKYTAEASSHEAGHGFGLRHQSLYNGSGGLVQEYYSGPGDGRAPIMGNSYNAARGLWWYGTSTSYVTYQDDMAVIARPANGFGYRADDYPNTPYDLEPLVANTGDPIILEGVVATTTDGDYVAFDTGGGDVTLTVTVPSDINNLDSKLQLRNENLVFLDTQTPPDSFGAQIVATDLPPGRYYAAVGSNGGYGDVGQYTLSIEAPAPAGASVVGRSLFYNQSSYDDNTPGIDPSDGAAIATDKSAYLPGSGTITPASMSSYARGINGLFVDVAGPHGTLSPADFEFAISGQETLANNTPSTWSAAPPPVGFTVLADTPSAGIDRVEFIWADHAIENQYLEVTVKGNDARGGFNTNTGLPSSDVFYFGSIVGDTFVDTSGAVFLTSSADEIEIQPHIASTATIASVHDVDRNGLHLSSDRIVVRSNTITALNRIDIANPPAAPAAADFSDVAVLADGASFATSSGSLARGDSGGSAVATALAMSGRPEAHATDAPRASRVAMPAAGLADDVGNRAAAERAELVLVQVIGDILDAAETVDEMDFLEELVAELRHAGK